jgi:hypothetical protein
MGTGFLRRRAERYVPCLSGTGLSVLGAIINGYGEPAGETCTTPTAHCEADKAIGEQHSYAFGQAYRSTRGDGAARHE